MDTQYFDLLELQRVLRYIQYEKLNLQYLGLLKQEIAQKIKEKQEEKKNG